MKRAISALTLTCLIAGQAMGQADAVALAAQREAEENYKRLSATVDEIQTAQAAQRQRLSDLASEVSKLREEVARANNNAAMQDSIKRLSDQIVKVGETRIADNKRIHEALKELSKLIAQTPITLPPAPKATDNGSRVGTPPGNGNGTTTPRPAPSRPEEGYEYVVQSGDRLDLIVKAYRSQNIPVTSKMVMDANPNVRWERLQVGQKIFIPKPK